MKLLRYIIRDSKDLDASSLSLDEIVKLMQPTDIKNMYVPRVFATAMKEILVGSPNCIKEVPKM